MLSVLFLLGCGQQDNDQETPSPDPTTRQQPIVFGAGNAVNQPTQELLLGLEVNTLSGASPPTLKSTESWRMFKKLMVSRASPVFSCASMNGSYDQNDDAVLGGCGSGSGLLGTSNIVWTADHVIDYYAENQTVTQPPSQNPPTPPTSIFQDNLAVFVFSIDWFDVRPFHLVKTNTTPGGLRNHRDTWYLRHRLHGLGLTNYVSDVINTQDYNDRIRVPFETWYHPDFDKVKRYGTPHQDSTGTSQPTTDVAWVKLAPKWIVGKDPETPDEPLVGKPFQLGGPGMFFGFYRALCITGSNYVPDGVCSEPSVNKQQLINHFATNIPQSSAYVHLTTPTTAAPWSAYGYAGARFMYEKLMTQDLVAGGGTQFDNHIREAPFTDNPIYSTSPTVVGQYSSSGVPIERAMRVQLDARRGHSGGPIITDPSNARSGDLGYFHAILGSSISNNMVTGPIEGAGYHYGYLPHNSSEAEIYAGVIGGYMAEEVRKETGNQGTPWRSSVDDCENMDLDLCADDCIEQNPNNIDNCRIFFEDELEGPSWTDTPAPKRDPSIEAALCLGQGCDNGTPPARTQSSVKQLRCKDRYQSSDTSQYLGSGLGVVGGHLLHEANEPVSECPTSQVEVGSSNAVLGSLGLICGPRSKREWSMNWDFIRVEYRSLVNDCLQTPSVAYILNAYLNQSYLVREEVARGRDSGTFQTSNGIVSPAPMLMCPPGYVMQGMKVNYDPEKEVITGIQGVFCSDLVKLANDEVQPANSDECQADPQKRNQYPCYVPSRLDAGDGKPIYRGEDATLFETALSAQSNERFELPTTQYLGNPNNTSNNTELALCPDDQQVISMWVPSANDEPTRFIELNCDYKPGMAP